jgi:hypothetical protein
MDKLKMIKHYVAIFCVLYLAGKLCFVCASGVGQKISESAETVCGDRGRVENKKIEIK